MSIYSSAVHTIQLLEEVEEHMDSPDLADWLVERIGRAYAELDADINYLEQLSLCD